MKKQAAWIETIDEADADAALRAIYEKAADPQNGQLDHIMKIHSLNPQSLLDHLNLYQTLMYGKSPIKRPQREMIAVVVSAVNRCRY